MRLHLEGRYYEITVSIHAVINMMIAKEKKKKKDKTNICSNPSPTCTVVVRVSSTWCLVISQATDKLMDSLEQENLISYQVVFCCPEVQVNNKVSKMLKSTSSQERIKAVVVD